MDGVQSQGPLKPQSSGLINNVFAGEWTRNPKIVDLNDSAVFLDGFPHAAMDRIRREYPVYWNEEAPDWGPGFWNLTRYADIVAASRDPGTFSSASGINISYGPDSNPEIVNSVVGNMICMDPPMHRVYRNIAKPFFTRSWLASLEGRIHELVTGILDRTLEKKDCDFMAEVAAPLPISVLCDILGVPQEDWKLIFDWSNILIGFEDPEFGLSREFVEGTFLSLFGYGQQLIADRRANPRNDLMTAIATAKPEDGAEIPEHLLNGFFLLMVIAGNETTRNSISGGMHALIQNPAERAKLERDPALLAGGIEEILRWVSPVNHMRRTATRDTEVRGVKIAAGDKVVLWYPAANRDPDVFARPQTFDVTRTPNEHLAFGIGEHFCLGAQLARLQLRVMFKELLSRTRQVHLTGPVRHMRTNFINGIKAMPVRIEPA
jgi:cholest-4-en-3-one 26-monooxygenase